MMVRKITSQDDGRPVGNIFMGRRFNVQELLRLDAGEPIEKVVAAAGHIPSREEMYTELFGDGEQE